jgi:hypothetical protein
MQVSTNLSVDNYRSSGGLALVYLFLYYSVIDHAKEDKQMSGIKKGMKVTFKPEWQDAGDSEIEFIAIEDEYSGRVRVEAQLGMFINPIQLVLTEYISTANFPKSR